MPAATAVHFFLELAAILVTCRLVGLLSQRLGQPQVVGEMVAGVVLGPSLLGRLAPDIQHHLFPPGPSNIVLYTAAQIGLVLYMFLIGLNFDVNLIKHRVGTAAAVSSAGILTPLALGALIAAPLLAGGIYFDKGVTLIMAMMFLGAFHCYYSISHACPNYLRTRALWNTVGHARVGLWRNRRCAVLVHSGDGAGHTPWQRRRSSHSNHRRNSIYFAALDNWA